MELTSQTWLTENDSSQSVWKHWVTICVPNDVEQIDTSLVYIDGGSNTNNAPGSVDPMTLILCTKTKSVVSDIRQIPNEPSQMIRCIRRIEKKMLLLLILGGILCRILVNLTGFFVCQ